MSFRVEKSRGPVGGDSTFSRLYAMGFARSLPLLLSAYVQDDLIECAVIDDPKAIARGQEILKQHLLATEGHSVSRVFYQSYQLGHSFQCNGRVSLLYTVVPRRPQRSGRRGTKPHYFPSKRRGGR